MEIFGHPLAIVSVAHILVVFAASIRVVSRRLAPGVTLAWLFLVFMLPFAGAIVYLLIGERRITGQRAHRIDELLASIGKSAEVMDWADITDVDWSAHPPTAAGLGRLGRKSAGCSTLRGSDMELYSDTQQILQAIARDVDAAKSDVSMTFYIWNEGGNSDEVLEALIRAADRGVSCRVLVDTLGSRPWLQGEQPARLRAAGVQVCNALPVGLLHSFVGRTDLRLHRKIVVIDNTVAWTGSMNLVDPRMFKQDAGVGEWVDAMVRVQGSAVAALSVTALGDWMLETGTSLEELARSAGIHRVSPGGTADVQVVPTGPGESGSALLQMLLALINAATQELVITTPYLVPDESVLWARRGAAGRGVKVIVIVPERVDSLLTRHASYSYFDDLLNAGIEICLYQKGLLHTKSICVDGTMSMFGTVNLDMRSLWLNYEVTLFVYDRGFAGKLRTLQGSYIADSGRLDPAKWAERTPVQRFLDNTLRLMSPLL
jgi:cardiolipin synthase